MAGTLSDAFHLQLKVSGSTSQSENPLISISELINDPRLPNELITEIFLRLPVKSLLKFKCISKWWLSRISSAEFIKSHFSISCEVGKEGEYLQHQLLFTVSNRIKQSSLHSALHEAEPPTLVCDFEQLIEDSNIYPPCVVGIINGLVCLVFSSSATKYCLWNPALRKLKHLPSPIVNLDPAFRSVTLNHGFGYDEINNDYKVFCVLMLCGSEGVYKEEVKVYSLRADSWRVNDDLKGLFPDRDPATYADGKMYWFVNVEGVDSTLSRKVVSLDMASEKCGELQQPAYEIGLFGWNLGVVCGRLYALCDHIGTKLDIFVMDKYEGEECWRKVDSILLNDVYRRIPLPYQTVICFVSDDEIVIRNGRGLLVYHRKHKTTRNIEVNVGRPNFRVVPYIESLVSPSPDASNV